MESNHPLSLINNSLTSDLQSAAIPLGQRRIYFQKQKARCFSGIRALGGGRSALNLRITPSLPITRTRARSRLASQSQSEPISGKAPPARASSARFARHTTRGDASNHRHCHHFRLASASCRSFHFRRIGSQQLHPRLPWSAVRLCYGAPVFPARWDGVGHFRVGPSPVSACIQ